MPRPRPRETDDEFIQRCMGDSQMQILENNYSESKIINITKYSKGTIYRAKKIANLLNE